MMKWTKAELARIEIARQAEQLERDLSGIRRAIRRPLDAVVATGELTVPQTSVMRIVVRQHGISVKDLAIAVSLSQSTVSGIVDRLEKRGLVEKRADSQDGRLVRVYPTAVVENFVRDEIQKLNRRPLEQALERATEGERKQISAALQKLRELLEVE
jgi:DNA-binding MarR family transcriptional regulator